MKVLSEALQRDLSLAAQARGFILKFSRSPEHVSKAKTLAGFGGFSPLLPARHTHVFRREESLFEHYSKLHPRHSGALVVNSEKYEFDTVKFDRGFDVSALLGQCRFFEFVLLFDGTETFVAENDKGYVYASLDLKRFA